MAPALLCPSLLRVMASRFITSSFFRTRLSSFPSYTLSRTSFPLRKCWVPCSVPNAVTPRAFMSSISTAFHKSESSTAYSSDQIQVLEGLDPVRKRPAMYIGSTGPRGLHHLVYEILDNAVDEAQAGFASKIDVALLADDSVCITDNGRGVLHAGGKFGGGKSGYSVSGGLHGVGLSVVNALSESLEITVWRDGMEYTQTYSRGKPVTILKCLVLEDERKDLRGTRIRFWPDKEVFTTAIQFDYNTIAGRIRELAFLNPKLTITLQKEDNDPEKVQYNEYLHAGGLVEYVKWLNTDKKALHDVLSFRKEADGITVDIAFQWCEDAYSDTILGYANSIHTIGGGTHINAMKAAITRTLNSLGKKSKVIKEKDIILSGEHVREGLTCVVSVKVPNPEFEGQTKTRLGNPEVRKVVDQSIQDYLTDYLELHPNVLDSVLSKALNAFKVKPSSVNDTLSIFPTPLASLFSYSTFSMLSKIESSTDYSSDCDQIQVKPSSCVNDSLSAIPTALSSLFSSSMHSKSESSTDSSDCDQIQVKPSGVNDTLSIFPTPLSSLFSYSTFSMLSKIESSTDYSSDYDQIQFSDRPKLGKESKSLEKYCAYEMNVLAKYYGLHEAELYIEKTPEFCSREFLYRTLLANCVRQNNVKKAVKVFGKMQDFELPITVFTCNELLYLYMRNDCKEKIGVVLGLMEKENIKPSSLTYSILIESLGQSKDINSVNQAVDFMKAQGIEPAIHTQAVLAMHYILGGLQGKGETLLKEMEGAEYLKQNRWLCPILLHVYGNLGRVDEVGKIWEICETNPRYKECLVAIAAWGKLKKIEEAEKVYEMVCQVKKWKNFPESWEVMLKVYKDNNMLMDHKKLLRQMGASECFMDPVTLDKIVK